MTGLAQATLLDLSLSGMRVLVTAGASAPEDVVEACVSFLGERYGATVENRVVREEHVSFPLPRELRVLAPDRG